MLSDQYYSSACSGLRSSLNDEIDNVDKYLNALKGINEAEPILIININIIDTSNERICVYKGDTAQ